MPYIDGSEFRRAFVEPDSISTPLNAGELNYQLTRLIVRYRAKHGERYQTYNDIFGALMGALLELYRTQVAPYEDKKREDNGDVYSV